MAAKSTLDELKEKLSGAITEDSLKVNHLKLASVLKIIGVIRDGKVVQEDLVKFFKDPGGVFDAAYDWKSAKDFKGGDFVTNFKELAGAFEFEVPADGSIPANIDANLPNEGTPAKIYLLHQTNGVETGFGFYLYELPNGFGILPFMEGSLKNDVKIPIKKKNGQPTDFSLILNIGVDLASGVGISVEPGKVGLLLNVAGGGQKAPSSLKLKFGVVYEKANGDPIVLLKLGEQSRVEVGSFSAALTSLVNTKGEYELIYEASLSDGKFVIKADEKDGFLKQLLPKNGIEGNFEIPIALSIKGIFFPGSSGLEISIPTHIQIGPVEILGLTIRAQPDLDKMPISVAADLKGKFGPLDAVVKGMGFKNIVSFPKNSNNMELETSFLPPTGVGLSIEGGGFTGGGFLFLDYDKGEYAGGLELEFQKFISLKAIGILNTKMPGGKEGFSLLIIITAEFTPIQLGFGFTLIGVGGLLGLNRTMELEPLRLGVYDGSINSILFPQDIVANADRIINDLKRIFPPKEDQFVFGPMGKLGWGTPTLISVELGFLLEVDSPVRIALLGVMRLSLPTEQAAIVYIQLNFLATIDFDKKQFTLDASLFNSRILTFALTGDMAMRIYWGDNANFLFTVGGFHPSYTPPPMGLPALKRLSLIVFSGNPDLRAEAYFAVTSNTVQFGAKLSLRAEGGPAAVHGYLSMDALIQFNPFKFLIEIGAMLAVSIFGSDLLSVRVRLSLEGPSPWHAWGEATVSISFFFFDVNVTVSFDVTFGEDKRTIAPPVEVFNPLLEAFKNPGNWRAELPKGANLMVSMREIPSDEQADQLILHPFGILQVSQKVAPLNLDINKFGADVPLDLHRYFQVNSLALGAEIFGQDRLDVLKEQFAPAQYQAMTDAQKLSSQSFTQFNSGVRIKGTDKLQSSYIASLLLEYELIYVPEKRSVRFWQFFVELFVVLLRNNAAAQSQLAYEPKRPSPLDAPKTSVKMEEYVVANADNLENHLGARVFTSEAEANAARTQLVAQKPELLTKLAVMPKYHLN